jgi:hypothetical protein
VLPGVSAGNRHCAASRVLGGISLSRSSKPIRSTSSRVATVIVAFVLAGCAASVQQAEPSPSRIDVPANAARKIVLVVTGSDLATRSSDWEALRGEWRSAMSTAAAGAGLDFEWREGLANLPRTAGTVALVKVNDYRYLSTGARYGFGAFAGNAFIDSEVSFRELPSGKVIGSRKYNTSSTAWQGIFSAMTSKQVQAICEQIVADIRP